MFFLSLTVRPVAAAGLLLVGSAVLISPAAAQPLATGAAQEALRTLQPGDCLRFREGGRGRLFKSPTWWLRGTVVEVRSEHRRLELCPRIDKPRQAFSVEDWTLLAAALPCAESAAALGREVEVTRVQLRVDAWETPWTRAHGESGWLFRGQFLDQPLRVGALLDLDASWLGSCAE